MVDSLKNDVERLENTRKLLFEGNEFSSRERVDFAISRMAMDNTFATIFMGCVKEAISKTIKEKSQKVVELERELSEL